jgi:hypothetical protein
MNDQEMLLQARTIETRLRQMLGRGDLPPIVRIRTVAAEISIQKLIQAVLEGR